VRAVENALGIVIPDNARILRNLLEGAQFIQDHVIHFYHLHALDWVDIVSALSADTTATSALQRTVSDWPNSSPEYFQTVKNRLATFVNSGQLGLFANGYWGHPAYKLAPEANLMAAAHYLEALDFQREYIKFHAVLGGKNPHPQTYLVGGMAISMDRASTWSINDNTIAQLRSMSQTALDFVTKVYIPDLLAIASYYKDWAGLGAGPGNYLSYGDWPAAPQSSYPWGNQWLPRGLVFNKNIASAPQTLDANLIGEYVSRSWYSYTGGDALPKNPALGETVPNYTGPQPPFENLNTDGKYSWLKSPRYSDTPMEVGPLARMLVAYAAGHTQVRQEINTVLTRLGLGPAALFSTLGRVAARGVETLLTARKMTDWITELQANLNSGNLAIHEPSKWNPSSWPTDAQGWGATEAPRGALGHWIQIRNGRIENYQAVVATAWNGAPRDGQGQRGVWEEALIGTPITDPQRPVEVLRTIHSFDPCMACSVHIVDGRGRGITRVRVQ
jgi:Ni,Fe-hydrogenase I large subunit